MARLAGWGVAADRGRNSAGDGGIHGGRFFPTGCKGGLQRDARQLLGGDVVLVSDSAPLTEWLTQARRLDLDAAQTLSFPTMARAFDALGGAARSLVLKAVSSGRQAAP
ncbi:MAG: hypothetical protein LBI48_07750 [Burkholderiaceae bacterium]|nr:hypothetical protein [Burkholderiaceae bacterium]